MPPPKASTKPQRKSARIKDAREKISNSDSNARAQSTRDCGHSRRHQMTVDAPLVREATDHDSESEDLPSRMSRGSLSKLPTMPLDILLEIFTHVIPVDLLNFAYINKSFSELLLSRRSISIWRATLGVAGLAGYPPKPEDWTEFAWVRLVSGSKLCNFCGKRTTLEVLWALRKRLCKACRDKHVIPYGDRRVEHRLRDTNKDIVTIVPISAHMYFWCTDIVAYHRELEKLSRECQDKTLFLAKRDELDAQMATRTRLIMDHARLCEEGSMRLKEGQVADKEEQTIQRVTLIYERLLGLGFESADLEESLIRRHKDVDNPRLLTKEVWERLKPTLIELAEKARQTRLEREKTARRQAREKAVAIEYRTFLKCIAPGTVSLMPSVRELLHLPQVAVAVAKDQEATDKLHRMIAKALVVSLPEISDWITTRAEALRRDIPESWPVGRFDRDPSTKSDSSSGHGSRHELDLHSSVADLDLAVYAFTCGRAQPKSGYEYCDVQNNQTPEVHYGLDILSHPCPLSGSTEVKFKPLSTYHRAVLCVLKLLQLDPASATVTMLDDLDPAFVDSSTPRGWSAPQAYTLMTWRGAVERIKDYDGDKVSTIRLLTPRERQWFSAKVIDAGGRLSGIPQDPGWHSTPVECLPVWGCSHCFAHLEKGLNRPIQRRSYDAGWCSYTRLCSSQPDDPWRWFTFRQVRAHMNEMHSIALPCSGQDYFFNRHISRKIHTGFPVIPASLSVGETSQFA